MELRRVALVSLAVCDMMTLPSERKTGDENQMTRKSQINKSVDRALQTKETPQRMLGTLDSASWSCIGGRGENTCCNLLLHPQRCRQSWGYLRIETDLAHTFTDHDE